MALTCSNGHENSDSSSFCSTCGTSLATESPSGAEALPASTGRNYSQAPWFKPALIAGVALLLLGGGAGAAVAISNAAAEAEQQKITERDAAEAAKEVQRRLNVLPNAAKHCTTQWKETIGDGGLSLILDMEGEEYGSGILTFSDIACILEQLEVSDSVYNSMVETRSLDGRLSAEWGEVKASWTYHPDDGLDITIELVD